MQASELIQTAVALLFTLSLIMLVAWLVRRFGMDKRWQLRPNSKKRLVVIERLMIDPKRQLVLVRRDEMEHLLVLGQQEAQLVESFRAVNPSPEPDNPTDPSA
jgi:flagellar protein FliO/FliZ